MRPDTDGFSVDFHNHLMPGADDGARDLGDAREALAALRTDGVHVVVAGVHVSASELERIPEWSTRLRRIDRAFEELAGLAAAEFAGMRLLRGAELRLDAPSFDLSDARLRLAGGVSCWSSFRASRRRCSARGCWAPCATPASSRCWRIRSATARRAT